MVRSPRFIRRFNSEGSLTTPSPHSSSSPFRTTSSSYNFSDLLVQRDDPPPPSSSLSSPPRLSLDMMHSCQVCFNVEHNLRICSRCNARACTYCFKSWLDVRMQFGTAHNITCLACSHLVTDDEIRRICGDHALKKCIYFRSKFDNRHNPHAIWCPKEGCWAFLSNICENLPRHVPVFDCPDCHTSICRHCYDEAHPNVKCPIPTATFANRTMANFWQKLHTKKCPYCGVRIERAGGCSQMRCTSCQTKFCWRCRGILHVADSFVNDAIALRPRALHRCICPRVHSTMSWISLTGGIVIVAPFALAAAVVAAPPALVVYSVLSSEHKRQVRRDVDAFFRRL